MPHRPTPPNPTAIRAMRHLFSAVAIASLAACGTFGIPSAKPPADRSVSALLPADAILIGEQHDAPAHHAIEREAIEQLAAQRRLAAVALEMAEDGNDTSYLPATATEAQVQTALAWSDKAWPWSSYGPAVMAAVRAGVPVIGANLPRERMRDAMSDVSLDVQLSKEALASQQDAVRAGHCNLLPESQIGPMTRIQIARDRSMAQALIKARVPGKTVLLISGAGHATRMLGVPQHLPSDMAVKSIRLQAGTDASTGTTAGPSAYDATWSTPALPDKDYCAELKAPA